MIIGMLRWGWVEVILRVSLEVILLHLLRQKVKNSQARTGHQRVMGGRETDDDGTRGVSDTQTHTSSQDTQPAGLPHITSKRTALRHSRPRPPCRPPQHSKVPNRNKQGHNNTTDDRK